MDAVDGRDGPVVVVLGRDLGRRDRPTATVHAASLLARVPERAVPVRARRRQRARRARPRPRARLPPRPRDPRRRPRPLPGDVGRRARRHRASDAAAILQAAAQRARSTTLVLVGCDPLADFPDRRARPRRARAGRHRPRGDAVPARRRVEPAAVVLPPTRVGRAGRHDDQPRRPGACASRARVAPEGSTLECWRIPVELAARLGTDLDLETLDEVQDEIARRRARVRRRRRRAHPPGPGRRRAATRRARRQRDLRSRRAAAGRPSWEPIPPVPEVVDDGGGNGAGPATPDVVGEPAAAARPAPPLGRQPPAPDVIPLDAYASAPRGGRRALRHGRDGDLDARARGAGARGRPSA